MTTVTLQATYRDGVLQLPHKLDLPEGATVELQITPIHPPADRTARFGELAGVWSYLTDAEANQLEAELYRLKRQTAERVRQLRDSARNPHD
jgi:predicted DNA-binding antitoxin AbrB/MazE fold protein